jgi:hypothetical protein
VRGPVWVAVQAGSPEHKSPAPLVWTLLHCCANCLLRACRMYSILPREQIGAPCPPPIFARKDLRRGRSDGSVPRNRCAIHDLHLYYFENPRGEEPLGVVSLRGLFPLCFLRSDVRP